MLKGEAGPSSEELLEVEPGYAAGVAGGTPVAGAVPFVAPVGLLEEAQWRDVL